MFIWSIFWEPGWGPVSPRPPLSVTVWRRAGLRRSFGFTPLCPMMRGGDGGVGWVSGYVSPYRLWLFLVKKVVIKIISSLGTLRWPPSRYHACRVLKQNNGRGWGEALLFRRIIHCYLSAFCVASSNFMKGPLGEKDWFWKHYFSVTFGFFGFVFYCSTEQKC